MPSMDVQKPNTERVAQKPISAKNASDRKVQMRRLNLFVLDAGPSIKVLPNAKDKDTKLGTHIKVSCFSSPSAPPPVVIRNLPQNLCYIVNNPPPRGQK